jgi:monoamine oxidase
VFNSCSMGNFSKFIFTYEKPFWRLNGYSGEVLSDGSICLAKNEHKIGPISCVYDATTPDNDAALAVFLGGDGAIYWNSKFFVD